MKLLERLETAKIRHPLHNASPRAQRVSISMWDLAVWTYQAQKAHRDYGRVGGNGYSSRSQTAVLSEICASGGHFGGGCAIGRTYADDDALSVHEMVLRMSGDERALIIGSAKTARVPDWSPLMPPYRAVPVRGRKGKPKGLYDKSGNLIGHELDYEGFSPRRAADVLRYVREVYTDWYLALYVLREALVATDELRRWAVTGIGAEREPWRCV